MITIEPIQPNNQKTMMPVDAYAGQKLERSHDIARPVVERKNEIPDAREDIPREEVEKALDKLNRFMNLINKGMRFDLHEEKNSEEILVRIVDQDSEKVLKEASPKWVLELLHNLTNEAGLFVDQRV
ncbi:flagellar protein FlaG [Desulfitobacterium dichloroeliminans LMG P-21439]|uniref:Flagellar protein FlaG n=1 Tax=Desulfitobacterium dichloroeliminans (strain LMG P-21439 / DCA1) TaxID=871963 RepID=L0FBG8_DESDL|nr:flagellar protein FlaG [Desulfitobacterium dichloroeliminans]AGA70293.1 flagellar protein FlaG [Desulfitobacterium dichloroeliminans LMG P-21439]